MGINSTVFICNDAWIEVDKDPAGWWEETKRHLQAAQREPVEYGFGSYHNGFWAAHCAHADVQVLVAVGGNYATIVYSGHRGNKGHHKPEDVLDLLRLAAGKLGYDIVPREALEAEKHG